MCAYIQSLKHQNDEQTLCCALINKGQINGRDKNAQHIAPSRDECSACLRHQSSVDVNVVDHQYIAISTS
jgi:hypothetical protein